MIWVKYSDETSLLGECDLQVGRKMSGFEHDVMKLSETGDRALTLKRIAQ
jgi:hypothetical protein